MAKSIQENDTLEPEKEQEEDASKIALRGSKIYLEKQNFSNPTDYIVTEKLAQKFHTGDSSEAITEQIARNFRTTPMPIEGYVEDISIKYEIDYDIAWRLLKIKNYIKNKRKKDMNYDELLIFLKNAMNYGDMQIWLYKKQLEGVELTLNDKLKKFFEIKSKENILKIYDEEQNYNQNNINEIRKVLKKEIKKYVRCKK